jgi:hypothetical protein
MTRPANRNQLIEPLEASFDRDLRSVAMVNL